MKLLRTAGIIIVIIGLAFAIGACKPSGGGENTSAYATTMEPSITSEPATTGVQTTTADNAETTKEDTSSPETSFSQTTSGETATSNFPGQTSASSAATTGETTIAAPTSTNTTSASDPSGQTSATSPATQETSTSAPTTTKTGTTEPTTNTTTAQPTTTATGTTAASAQKFWSRGENFGWQQSGIKLGSAYSGRVRISFDMTSPWKAGASVGFADKDTAVEGYDDLIIVFRMNEGTAPAPGEEAKGYFDASSGGLFDKLATVYFNADIAYKVEIELDFAVRKYDAWVITPENVKTKIAGGFDFKSPASGTADDIGQVFVISRFANDVVYIQNLKTEKLS